MKRLKRMTLRITYIFVFVAILALQKADVNAAVSSYVKESKFKGEYCAEDNGCQDSHKNLAFSKKELKKNAGTKKLSNGKYRTVHIGDSDSWGFDRAYCKRAKIKDGKLTIWGSLDKCSSNNASLSRKKYAKRVLSMSKNCKIYGGGYGDNGYVEQKISKSEFNRIFNNKRFTIEFIITVKNNKVTRIMVTA